VNHDAFGSGCPRRSLVHAGPVLCVTFAPDGKTLASGGADKKPRLWDARTGKEATVLEGHTMPVRALAFSADGKPLSSGGGQSKDGKFIGEICLWHA
jgi:WD40 repeat protein